jgi:hypothetical protein
MKKLATIAALLLLALTEPSTAPARTLAAQSIYRTFLSVAPAGGTTITLELPAERFRAGTVPLVERPGQPHRIGGGR